MDIVLKHLSRLSLIILFCISLSHTWIIANNLYEYDTYPRLNVSNVAHLESLIKHWNSNPNRTSEDDKRIKDRIQAIKMTKEKGSRCFDYTSMVPTFNVDDIYFLEFSNTYGTHLDCQLHKELHQTRDIIHQLTRTFPENEHILHIAPIVHLYAAYAKTENDPYFAFELADFCRVVTQMLSQGIKTLHDSTCSIGKGIHQGTREFFSLQHCHEIVTGIMQLGYLCCESLTEPNMATFLMLPEYLQHPDTFSALAKKDSIRLKDTANTMYEQLKKAHKKIKDMSWQEFLENGAHWSTLTILQILSFHALNNFILMKMIPVKINTRPPVATTIYEGSSLSIEGFKTFVIDHTPTIPTKAINVIRNNNSLFKQAVDHIENLKPILPNINNVLSKRIGTVWEKIKPTDLMYPGTKIPKSFELTVGKQKFWVCPNSTEHMLEYIQDKIKTQSPSLNSNFIRNNDCGSKLRKSEIIFDGF